MLQIEIQENTEKNAIIFSLEGTIDVYSCRQLEDSVNKLINEGKYKIVVDLSKVNYMTSVGAGIFMGVHAVTKENKGSIILVNPHSEVKDIFRLLGVDKIIDIVPDIKTALSKLNS
ncbi:MAG: STAS domain-containing protein [Planctomycetes bacterium]|nr:STAS domain-containing protein [Planctomycetota bacterium]